MYTSYNTYGMLWSPTTITFYFDGQAVAQEATPADMNVPMYMIANLAVGGAWSGLANGETSQMKIDYIRAYSSDAAIPAVALQSISSPDGGGSNFYGASVGTTAPATPGASPNDTVLKAGSSAAITDANSNVWTITSGRQVAVNGVTDAATSNVIEVAYVNGTIWELNASFAWRGETKPNDSWSAATTTSPLPFTVSPADTEVLAGSTAAITDSNGNTWTITSGGQVAIDGVTDAATSSVTKLANVNGEIWQENSSNLWYGESSPNDSWSAGTSTSPLVITVPATEASVTVALSSATINAASGNHLLFISGSSDSFNLSGGVETIQDSGSGGNTFDLPAAGNGSAVFNAAVLADADVFNLTAALAGTAWTGSASSLSSFLHVAHLNGDTELQVSAVSAHRSGIVLATFDSSTVTLSTILSHSVT
jgi:hypothetical protein